jgi:cytoskeletal protein CcmA (bactofilin family)
MTVDDLLSQANDFHMGPGVRFVGSITAKGVAHIQGEVAGEVFAATLKLGRTGQIRGVTACTQMDLHGHVDAHLTCSGLLTVHGSAQVIGQCQFGEIEIKKGARVTAEMAQIGLPRARQA